MKNRKISSALGVIALAILSCGLIQCGGSRGNAVIIEAFQEVQKQLPMQVDPYTSFDSIAYDGNALVTYYYSVTLPEDQELDFDGLEDNMKQVLINTIKTDPQMEMFRKKKFTFAYSYFDQSGRPVFDISVTPEMYK